MYIADHNFVIVIHQTSYDDVTIAEMTNNVNMIINKSESQQQAAHMRNEIEANIYHYINEIDRIKKHVEEAEALANLKLEELKKNGKNLDLNAVVEMNKMMELTFAPIDSVEVLSLIFYYYRMYYLVTAFLNLKENLQNY